MSLSSACAPFDQELESIQEFFQRFQCQMSDSLHKVRNDDIKRAHLLLKSLPVSVISELQRRLAPTALTEATYTDIEEHLLQQFSSSKSEVGASVQFLTYKKQPGQTIEDYSRKLNSLASQCNYPSACLDRLLRDAFVAELCSSSILSTLIQECDKLTFRETLERAKLLQAFRQDVDKISSSRHKVYATVDDSQPDDIHKINSGSKTVLRVKTLPNDAYLCYRCGAKGKHFSNDCFAKKMICHQCNKMGHISRICQQNKRNPASTPNQSSSGSSCRYVDAHPSCYPDAHSSTHTHSTEAAVIAVVGTQSRTSAGTQLRTCVCAQQHPLPTQLTTAQHSSSNVNYGSNDAFGDSFLL